MKKIVPIKPDWKEISLLVLYIVLNLIGWLILLFATGHIIAYYLYLIRTIGFFDKETIRICVYIIGGIYLLLFIHRDQVRKIFKVKK